MATPKNFTHSSRRTTRSGMTRKKLAAYSAAAASGALMADTSAAAVIPIQLPGGQPVVIENENPNVNVVNYRLDVDGDGLDDFSFHTYLGPSISGVRPFGQDLVAADYMVSDVRIFNSGQLIDDDTVAHSPARN